MTIFTNGNVIESFVCNLLIIAHTSQCDKIKNADLLVFRVGVHEGK